MRADRRNAIVAASKIYSIAIAIDDFHHTIVTTAGLQRFNVTRVSSTSGFALKPVAGFSGTLKIRLMFVPRPATLEVPG